MKRALSLVIAAVPAGHFFLIPWAPRKLLDPTLLVVPLVASLLAYWQEGAVVGALLFLAATALFAGMELFRFLGPWKALGLALVWTVGTAALWLGAFSLRLDFLLAGVLSLKPVADRVYLAWGNMEEPKSLD